MAFSPDATPPVHAGLSSQACTRCRVRKKRCDRTLPCCNACVQSKSDCSFQDHPDSEEMGLFHVSYVRHLERQVRDFKQNVANGCAESDDFLDDSNSTTTRNQARSPTDAVSGNSPSGYREEPQIPASCNTPPHTSSGRPHVQEAHGSFATEVELLSLRATAEQYLGSSSGVSFARLTQAVLKRLRSDRYPFSFDNGPSEQPWSARQSSNSPWNSIDEPTSHLKPASIPALPSEEEAYRLVEYYWCHTHTLYPFIRKKKFMESLKRMYTTPDDPVMQSSTWQYTMWMVFAISSTTLSSVMMTEETESVCYWNNAMLFFEGALARGNMSALNALLLQICYSFFNQLGPNTWYLVGMAERLAFGMGLHTTPSNRTMEGISPDVLEHRKRLFFCLYMMDRMVSIALGRPFGIRDEDVEIEPFADIDEEDGVHSLPQRQLALSAMAVPLHILLLRKISGEIFQEVYTTKNQNLSTIERDRIVESLHEKLIHWRRTMPFPLPEQVLRVPHLSTTWFDLNYHSQIVLLYRPSPLFPVLNLEKVTLLAGASAMAIRHAVTMHRQQRFAFNWLNLFSMFTSMVALVYSVTAQPEALSSYLQRSEALSDLRLAADLLRAFEVKFPSARKCREMLEDVISRLESYLPRQSRLTLGGPLSPLAQSTSPEQIPHHPQSTFSPSTDGSATAYPLFLTGNASYDALLGLVQGFEYDPALEVFDF